MIVQPIQWKGVMVTTMNHKSSFPRQTLQITIPPLHPWARVQAPAQGAAATITEVTTAATIGNPKF